jgi:hypothetical protein
VAKDSLTSGCRIIVRAFASSRVWPLRQQPSISCKCVNLAWRLANDFARRNFRTDTAAAQSNVQTAARYLLTADLLSFTPASFQGFVERLQRSPDTGNCIEENRVIVASCPVCRLLNQAAIFIIFRRTEAKRIGIRLLTTRGAVEEKAPQRKSLQSLIFTQSGRRDSNPRPPEPHGVDLSGESRQRVATTRCSGHRCCESDPEDRPGIAPESQRNSQQN